MVAADHQRRHCWRARTAPAQDVAGGTCPHALPRAVIPGSDGAAGVTRERAGGASIEHWARVPYPTRRSRRSKGEDPSIDSQPNFGGRSHPRRQWFLQRAACLQCKFMVLGAGGSAHAARGGGGRRLVAPAASCRSEAGCAAGSSDKSTTLASHTIGGPLCMKSTAWHLCRVWGLLYTRAWAGCRQRRAPAVPLNLQKGAC